MVSKISPKFYGKHCPLAETFLNGDRFEKLPEYKSEHDEALKLICGYNDDSAITESLPNIESIRYLIYPKWFKEIDDYLDIPILGFLAKYGLFLESMDWWKALLQTKGHLEFLERFSFDLSNRPEFIRFLAERGKLDILRWAFKNKAVIIGDEIEVATEWGHLDVVKFLYKQDVKPYNFLISECMAPAALYGHLEILKWLVSHGGKWNSNHTARQYAKLAKDNGFDHVSDWIRNTIS